MSFTAGVFSKSSAWNSLNIKELLAQNKRDIGDLTNCNGIPIHNH